MELQDMKMMSSQDDNKEEIIVVVDEEEEEEEEEGSLPGFRFHPTDEELVSFYLKRKIQKRPISLEIIKQIDIYKHDPWELAKASSVGDKEWYFYCKRGRKYRNSNRPNRVITGSGFWKATGIDRPVYSNGGEGNQCVGLKKSLVYYRGSAGKGTKTEWMMHEFRLPTHQHSGPCPIVDTLQEAEIWTLCRIFKRNRKYKPDWRQVSAKRASVTNNLITSSKACSDESISNSTGATYISFVNPTPQKQQQESNSTNNYRSNDNLKSTFYSTSCTDNAGVQYSAPVVHPMTQTTPSDASNFSSPLNPSRSVDDQGSHGYGGSWDDLNSFIEFAARSPRYEEHYMYRVFEGSAPDAMEYTRSDRVVALCLCATRPESVCFGATS